MSTQQEIYNKIVKQYRGKYIVLSEEEVLFADDTFDIVYEKYKQLKKNRKCKITFVDDGEASFYGITIRSHSD